MQLISKGPSPKGGESCVLLQATGTIALPSPMTRDIPITELNLYFFAFKITSSARKYPLSLDSLVNWSF